MAILTAMIFALGATAPVMAAGTDADVVWTQGFDAGDTWSGLSDATVITTGGAQSGDGYLSLPEATSQYRFNFIPAEGGDDANYTLSFYAKTSVGKNLFLETIPNVSTADGEYYSLQEYSAIKGWDYIHGVGKAYICTGVKTTDGGEWKENRVDFHVPKGCNRFSIAIRYIPHLHYYNTRIV